MKLDIETKKYLFRVLSEAQRTTMSGPAFALMPGINKARANEFLRLFLNKVEFIIKEEIQIPE